MRVVGGRLCGSGGQWRIGRQLGDRRDGAVILVGDEFGNRLGARGGGWCAGGGACGLAEDGGDDLQVVEELAGALFVEIVGGDAAEELGGDGEGGWQVFDDGQCEGFLGVEEAEFSGGRLGAAGGVVEVAELLLPERRRAALAAVGVDVAALVAFLGDGDEFGRLRHEVPLGRFGLRSWIETGSVRITGVVFSGWTQGDGETVRPRRAGTDSISQWFTRG